MESAVYEIKLKFDWESETKRSNALYKSWRLEKLNDLNTNMSLIIVSCISVKLESESGNELVAHALHFYSAQKKSDI